MVGRLTPAFPFYFLLDHGLNLSNLLASILTFRLNTGSSFALLHVQNNTPQAYRVST
jgi:hypothetical protein